ncbi:Tkl protein kinase, partial [Globisporangium splendens]
MNSRLRNNLLQTLPVQSEDSQIELLILDENPIVELRCSFLNLQSISLQNIPSLRSIPDFVLSLSTLEKVVLSGNPQIQLQIQNQVSLSIKELYVETTQRLGVFGCPQSHRSRIAYCVSLFRHLSSCALTKAPVQLIEVMPELRVFNLSRNQITTLEPTSASVASKVQVLDLTENQLKNMSVIVEFASASPMLTELQLASNNFTTCNFSSPQSPLEKLNLSTNMLEDCELPLPKLRILYLTGNPIDPWELSEDEFFFLGNLSQFTIQQSAFASCPTDSQQTLHNYRVCLKDSSTTPTVAPSVASVAPNSTTVGSMTPSSDRNQLFYIFASFIVALVICGVVYRVVKKKRSTANRLSFSPKSIACLGSPTGLSVLDSGTHVHEGFSASSYLAANEASLSLNTESHGRQSVSLLSRSVFTSSFRLPGGEDISVDDELAAWRVDYDSVQLELCLSVSTFVEVWEATYRLDRVAVKKLKPSTRLFYHKHADMVDPVVVGKFLMEIKVLSRLDHPRIIAFYGIAWKSESTILCVMEYMPQQDLHTFLRTQRALERQSDALFTSHAWTADKFHIAFDVLDALTYIHSLDPMLVHCDLKSRNVLLDDSLHAKLGDFGISKYLVHDEHQHGAARHGATSGGHNDDDHLRQREDGVMDEVRHLLSQTTGSIRWIAPEVLLAFTQYSEAVDIYAFGVLLSELDTLQLPYEDERNPKDGRPLSDARIRKCVAKGDLQPRFSPHCPPEVLEIGLRCLSYRPSDRPSSLELAYCLRKAAAAVLSKRSREVFNVRSSTDFPSGESTEIDWSRQTIELKPDDHRR